MQNYEQALRLQPENADTLCRKGGIFWDLWQYDEALEAANQAIVLDPALIRAYSLKMTTLSYLGREEEAKQVDALYQQLMSTLKQQALV